MTRFKQTDKVAPSKHTDNDIFFNETSSTTTFKTILYNEEFTILEWLIAMMKRIFMSSDHFSTNVLNGWCILEHITATLLRKKPDVNFEQYHLKSIIAEMKYSFFERIVNNRAVIHFKNLIFLNISKIKCIYANFNINNTKFLAPEFLGWLQRKSGIIERRCDASFIQHTVFSIFIIIVY